MFLERKTDPLTLREKRKYGRKPHKFVVLNSRSARNSTTTLTNVDIIGILAEPVVFEANDRYAVASIAVEGLCDLNDVVHDTDACPGDCIKLAFADSNVVKYVTLLVREHATKWSVALHPGQLSSSTASAPASAGPLLLAPTSTPSVSDSSPVIANIQSTMNSGIAPAVVRDTAIEQQLAGSSSTFRRMRLPETEMIPNLHTNVSKYFQDKFRRGTELGSGGVRVDWENLYAVDEAKGMLTPMMRQARTSSNKQFLDLVIGSATTHRTLLQGIVKYIKTELGGTVYRADWNNTSVMVIPALQIKPTPAYSTAVTKDIGSWTSYVNVELVDNQYGFNLLVMDSEFDSSTNGSRSLEEYARLANTEIRQLIDYAFVLFILYHQNNGGVKIEGPNTQLLGYTQINTNNQRPESGELEHLEELYTRHSALGDPSHEDNIRRNALLNALGECTRYVQQESVAIDMETVRINANAILEAIAAYEASSADKIVHLTGIDNIKEHATTLSKAESMAGIDTASWGAILRVSHAEDDYLLGYYAQSARVSDFISLDDLKAMPITVLKADKINVQESAQSQLPFITNMAGYAKDKFVCIQEFIAMKAKHEEWTSEGWGETAMAWPPKYRYNLIFELGYAGEYAMELFGTKTPNP